jgi:cytochrome c oxidase subunit 3
MGIILLEVRAQLPQHFLYIVTIVHLIHLAGGLISLLIIIYNHFKKKLESNSWYRTRCNVLALLDFLWIYLIVFYISLNKKKT